jgi:protein TonB
LATDAVGGPLSGASEASRSAKTSSHPIASLQNSSASQGAVEGKQPDKAEIDQIIAALVAAVEQHKRYPQAARRAGYEGIVQISVRIDRQGFIRGYELTGGSGRPLLDDAAVAIFRRIGDIRIASVSIDRDLTLIVPVRYALN